MIQKALTSAIISVVSVISGAAGLADSTIEMLKGFNVQYLLLNGSEVTGDIIWFDQSHIELIGAGCDRRILAREDIVYFEVLGPSTADNRPQHEFDDLDLDHRLSMSELFAPLLPPAKSVMLAYNYRLASAIILGSSYVSSQISHIAIGNYARIDPGMVSIGLFGFALLSIQSAISSTSTWRFISKLANPPAIGESLLLLEAGNDAISLAQLKQDELVVSMLSAAKLNLLFFSLWIPAELVYHIALGALVDTNSMLILTGHFVSAIMGVAASALLIAVSVSNLIEAQIVRKLRLGYQSKKRDCALRNRLSFIFPFAQPTPTGVFAGIIARI